MGLETILNASWLSLSALLVLGLGFDARSARICLSKRVAMLCLVAIFVFPCISATDDFWSFQALPEGRTLLQSRLPDDHKSTAWRLAQLFESLQSFALPVQLILALLLSFLGVANCLRLRVWSKCLTRRAGRSPPFISALI